MPHYPQATNSEEERDRDSAALPQLRTYVFPFTAPAGDASDAATSASTAMSPVSHSNYADSVHAFDESATPVVVRTPGLSTQTDSASAQAVAVPAAHAGLPPCLSVEELTRNEAVVVPPSRRGQRVRFAVTAADPAAHSSGDDGTSNASSSSDDDDNNVGTDASAPYGANSTQNGFADGFDYTTVESVKSDAESKTLEPYSMIAKTGGVHISLFTQILALLQRTARQYKRQIISLVAEVISPLFFVVLVIILNVAFGKESIAERVYAAPLMYSYQINSLDYRTYLCYNDSTQPINGLPSCARFYTPVSCDGDESGIPVYGLCYPTYYETIYQVVEQYVASMLGNLITIPTLDSIIVHQWVAKKAGLAASSRTRTALAALSDVGIGVSATTRYDSISYSGKLYFAPAANVPDALLAYMRSQSAMFGYVFGGTFATVAEAERVIKGSASTQETLDSVWGLIVINDIVDDFDVQIRLHGEALPTLNPPVSVEYRSGFFSDGTDMYLASGFMSLQKVLYDYFYATKANNGDLPFVASGAVSKFGADNVYTLAASFPSVKSENPYLFAFASSLVAFIIVLSFLYPFSQMTKRLVMEKELRIRESMCIMGLKRSSLWLNFLLVTFLEYLLICILLTILLCAVVATRSSSFTIFLILLLYALTLIPLSGLLSTFFSRARMAALMSPLFYFVLSMPIFAMGSAGRGAVIGLSILSPTGLAALLTDVFSAEAGSGFHASDFQNPYFSAKPYIVMIMLTCDVVLYLLLMFYLDVVLPQEWGTRRHPLFFITEPCAHWQQRRSAAKAKRQMANSRSSNKNSSSTNPRPSTPENARALEGTSEGLLPSNEDTALPAKISHSGSSMPVLARGSMGTDYAMMDTTESSSLCTDPKGFDPSVSRDSLTGAEKGVGVCIDNISKFFVRNGEQFAAVKNVSWKLYRGEIAVLLGPNGAGKSTTINMVTGMLASDSGDCFIEGHSVSNNTAQARHEIGYCPQHNILWPDLTCREHLEFYGKIKGLRGADLEDAVVDILRAVDLEEKIDCIPTLMSGGQKRKLSVAIAFVGRNSVVLLDEPTAGMDPAARRHTWSLLRVMAEQRTILLTTHYMDEADLLGGNVAIVNGGVLQCCGTTKFLRHYTGVGYTVRFDMAPISTQNGTADRQAKIEAVWAQLNKVVMRHLQNVRLVLQTDAEVEYELQHDAEAHITEFLTEMEARGNRQLGIRGYALKAPTLEDVFLRVVEHQIPSSGQRQHNATAAHPPGASGEDIIVPAVSPMAPSSQAGAHQREDRHQAASADRRTHARPNQRSSSIHGAAGTSGGSNSQLGSPHLAAAPLQRRMSRASLRYYNDETRHNYGGDAEEVEASEDASVTDAVMPFLSSRRGTGNRGGLNFFLRASGTFGDGEAEEPPAPSPNVSANYAAEQQQEQQLRTGKERSADLSVKGAVPGGGSTDAAGSHFAGEVRESGGDTAGGEIGEQASEGPQMPAPPVDIAAVRNEAFLYKHVTDRHLDQVWAARANSRGSTLWALQMRGMMYKRFYCAIRDRRMLFFQIVCPVLCILLAMLLQLVKSSNNGTLTLSPRAFRRATTMPVSSCARYYASSANLSAIDSADFGVTITDANFVSSTDMSYQLLDTWYMHPHDRYVGLQGADPTVQLFMRYSYAASLGSRSVFTILYNTSSHNSLPIGLHTAYAMAYYAGLGNASAKFDLSVTSLPVSKKSSRVKNAIAGILIGVIVLIPFTFLPANPVAWVVKEYETRARHLQTVSGLRYLIYWAGNFLFDFTAYVITIILVMIIFVIFQRSEYIGYATIGPTIVSFAIYGVCYCCCSYMVSFFFSEHTTAQLVVLGVSFLTGFLCVMLVFVLSLLDKTLSASNTLRWIFRLLPPFSIGEVILNLALLEQKKLTDESLTAWSMSITIWPDIYMAAEIPVFAAVTLLWDHPNRRAVMGRMQSGFRSWCCCLRDRTQSTAPAQKKPNSDGEDNYAGRVEAANFEDNSSSAALAGFVFGRRGSAGGSAAITPSAQRRVREAAGIVGDAASHVNRDEFGGPAAADATNQTQPSPHAVSPKQRKASQDQGVVSPSIRRRRVSVADSNEQAGEETNMPEGILVQSSSPFHPRSSARRTSQPGDGPSTMLLPSVLLAVTEVQQRRETSRNDGNSLRRHSVSERSRASRLNDAAPEPAEMVYPPPQWYVSDAVCLQEEDSDVEEERRAVYEDERSRQTERHLNSQPRTSTTPQNSKNAIKGKKEHSGGQEVLQTREDHQPQHAASSPEEMNADVIRVVDLRKVYDAPHKVAVSDLTFSVMHGEVFGFLGTNGAGKSSALSILTQEQLPTSGRAYVCGHDVVRDSFEAANCLGYCPQFDACMDLLTVKEHLRMYSLVRGVPVDRVEALVSSLLTICNLAEHRNVLSTDLSGGNRRKLSVAIALIGAPKVVCLDEPTSGLDPLARRLLWRALDRVSRKCSIILTTHHLEEVEALADCVGIMVDGGLRCFGDLPHLQHKYARNAYELTLCVSAAARQKAMEQQQQQAFGAAGRRSSEGGAASPNRSGAANASSSTPHTRGRLGSISYAGTDRIDTTDDIFQFMLRHFPSALLVDNFNNERYVYTLPATRDVANAMQRLQNHQQRRGSLSFRRQSCNSASTSRFSANNPIVRLSDVFEKLQASQDTLGITEYSVSQVSLEQVFLRVCGTSDESRLKSVASMSMTREPSTLSLMAPSSPSASRYLQAQQILQQQRKRRSSSVFVGNSAMASLAVDAASPSRRRLSVAAAGGDTKRVTFAEYRRQRALLRRRMDAEVPHFTPSETQRATEPDHGDSS